MKKEVLQYIDYIVQMSPNLVRHRLSYGFNKKICFFRSYFDDDPLKNDIHNNALLYRVYSIFKSHVLYFYISDLNTYSVDIRLDFTKKFSANELFYRVLLSIIDDFILLFHHYEEDLSDKKIKIPKLSQIRNKLSRTMKSYMPFEAYPDYMRAYKMTMGLVNSIFIEEMQDMFIMLFKYITPYCDNNMHLLDQNNISHVYNAAYMLEAAIKSFVTFTPTLEE